MNASELDQPLTQRGYLALLKRFYHLLENLTANAQEAGDILVRLVDCDPNTYNRILKESPVPMAREALDRMYLLGKHQLHLQLYLDTSDKSKLVCALPYADQVKFVEEGVPIPVRGPDGSVQWIVKVYARASKHDVQTVCGRTRLRTREEALEFLKQHALLTARLGRDKVKQLEIVDGKLVVRDKAGNLVLRLTERDLAGWLDLVRQAKKNLTNN